MDSFMIRLTETIAWCSDRASITNPTNRVQTWRSHWRQAETITLGNLATCLRTLDLQPVNLRWEEAPEIMALYAPAGTGARFIYEMPEAERQSMVDAVSHKRANSLREENKYPVSPVEDLAGGRLLFYMPDGTDHGGASENETEGFFDAWDVPPWDTWIYYSQGSQDKERYYFESRGWVNHPETKSRLVCWIPPALIEVVEDGIEVDPMSCLMWARNVDTELTRQLGEEFLK
jgi:hypothetical protein